LISETSAPLFLESEQQGTMAHYTCPG